MLSAILLATTLGNVPLNTEIGAISEIAAISSRVDRVIAFNMANTNVWFEATNYYETVGIPCSMQLYEIRDGETKLVWDQRKWEKYYTDEAVKAVTNRNDWSSYQSGTGIRNPLTNTTWMSTPKVVMAGGLEWQKTVTTKGNVFVLSSNGMVSDLNPTNSFFAITDLDDNELFAIKRTESVTLGATATSVSVDGNSLVATYSVQSTEHPTASVALTLSDGGIHFYEESETTCPATVAWSGSSGAWVATVTPKYVTTSLFVKAVYTHDGDTVPYLKVGSSKIRPRVTNGTVTWEVVQ